MRLHPKRVIQLILLGFLILGYVLLAAWSIRNRHSVPKENQHVLKEAGLLPAARDDALVVHEIKDLELEEEDKQLLKRDNPLPMNKKIPKILHQIYATADIPAAYAPHVKNCMQLNADYEYVLWTDEDADRFMREKYPIQYKRFYKFYEEDLSRNDAVRYFILYHYGGVYLDMDMACIRPLSSSPDIQDNSCVFDQERPEQTKIVHERPYSLMNSAMACRRKHLFLRFLMANLEGNINKELMKRAGPHFLTDYYMKYSSMRQADRYNYHVMETYGFSLRREEDLGELEGVLVSDSNMFSPFMDPENRQMCDNFWKKTPQSSLRYKGCAEWQRQNWSNGSISSRTICVHQFLHLGHPWWREKRGGIVSTQSIHELVPAGRKVHQYLKGETFIEID